MGRKLVTQFLKDEAQARLQWLELLMNIPDAPLDIAFKSKCEIIREYYPFAIYSMNCHANWTARSIWEHTEEYQVQRTETVYIDYMGREHDRPFNDVQTVDGKMVDHYRQPMNKIVYDTKKRTIVDTVQDSHGCVGPRTLSDRIALCDFPNLLTWASHFSDKQFTEVDDDTLSGCAIKTQSVSATGADNQAEKDAFSELCSIARRDVPGDRYENLEVFDFEATEVNRTVVYLAVYHIIYEYEGRRYECYISGSGNKTDVELTSHPTDGNLKSRENTLKTEAKKHGLASRKTIFLICIPFLLCASGLRAPFGQLCLVGAIYCGIRFYIAQNLSKEIAKIQERFASDNTSIRQRVLEISELDSISDEEKMQTIDEWLNNRSNAIAADDAQIETVLENQKTRIEKLNKIVISVSVAIILLSIIVSIFSGLFNGFGSPRTIYW